MFILFITRFASTYFLYELTSEWYHLSFRLYEYRIKYCTKQIVFLCKLKFFETINGL